MVVFDYDKYLEFFIDFASFFFFIEKIESSDPITFFQQLEEISSITLTCSCHHNIMLLALSSILVLGGDNTRKLLVNAVIAHILHKLPSLTMYDSISGASTIRQLSEKTRKIAIISSTLTDHLFICVSKRARMLRYIMCIAGQTKGWLGYSALLAAVTGSPLPIENVMFAATDELVETVLRDSMTSCKTLHSEPSNLRYNYIVCDKTINSVTNFINDIGGPRGDWHRSVNTSVNVNNQQYISEFTRDKRQQKKGVRSRSYPVTDTDICSTSSSDDDTSDTKDDDTDYQRPTRRRSHKIMH